jgi:hypothetical protein
MHRHADSAFDPRLDQILRRLIAWGVLAVLLLPAARGTSAWLGWMPLWLVAMPLASWWALHRFRLPGRIRDEAKTPAPRRRRRGMQARRRPDARPVVFARAA